MRCAMCGIWQEPKRKELTVTSIATLFHHPSIEYPLGSISLTGGEVFLHSKLNSIYRYLYLMKKKKRVAAIDVVTSGYLTKQIIGFLEDNKDYLAGLEMDFSIDGLEENHVMQRGWKDAWQCTWQTIHKVKQFYPEVHISVKYTINAHNIDDILPVYRMCKDKGLTFLPKFVEQGTLHYYHRIAKEHSLFILTPDAKEKALLILRLIQEQEIREQRPSLLLDELISLGGEKANVQRCRTPELSLFITANGDIYPCIYMDPIGNIFSDWYDALGGDAHNEEIKKGITGNCPKCISYHGYLRSWNCNKNHESSHIQYQPLLVPSLRKGEE